MSDPSKSNRRRAMLGLVFAVAALPLVAASCSSTPAKELNLSQVASEGQLIAKEFGCQGCHTIDGGNATGPSWQGIWGEEITLQDGSTVTVDAAYITESVRDPNASRRKGGSGQMGQYDEKRLSDADLAKIIEFIKELG